MRKPRSASIAACLIANEWACRRGANSTSRFSRPYCRGPAACVQAAGLSDPILRNPEPAGTDRVPDLQCVPRYRRNDDPAARGGCGREESASADRPAANAGTDSRPGVMVTRCSWRQRHHRRHQSQRNSGREPLHVKTPLSSHGCQHGTTLLVKARLATGEKANLAAKFVGGRRANTEIRKRQKVHADHNLIGDPIRRPRLPRARRSERRLPSTRASRLRARSLPSECGRRARATPPRSW
jgi:hypothetical protein